MEDEKIVGEQPRDENLTLIAEEQQEEKQTSEITGSPTGKFKSVEALFVAYQNLEKEFTQKCQKLKELTEKMKDSDNIGDTIPEYKRDDWEEKVKTFFENHPEAKDYVAEISNVLSSDEKIANAENSLENALTKILAQKFVPYHKLAEDEEFLEKYIYSNSKVSDVIVKKYLDNLSENRALPLISSKSGSGTVSSPINKPKTLKDAGKMVEAYLQNK